MKAMNRILHSGVRGAECSLWLSEATQHTQENGQLQAFICRPIEWTDILNSDWFLDITFPFKFHLKGLGPTADLDPYFIPGLSNLTYIIGVFPKILPGTASQRESVYE